MHDLEYDNIGITSLLILKHGEGHFNIGQFELYEFRLHFVCKKFYICMYVYIFDL